MILKFDERINRVYQIYDDLRRAELRGEADAVREKIAEGLVESCLLLQDILADDILGQIQLNPKDVKVIQTLTEQGKLEKFLNDVERKFLEFTKLNPEAIDELLEEVLVNIKPTEAPNPKWKEHLRSFTITVCDEARKAAKTVKHLPLFRRVFFAAGGAMVALINLVGLPNIPIPPPIKGSSVTIGIWCIGKATEGILEDLIGKKA
jgi:hypothetical protein